MDFDSTSIFSFLVVFFISSFCVSIGIGGGILYVPILGYLHKDFAQGVYLSSIAIFMTSLLGSLYHLANDVASYLKYRKSTTISEHPRDPEAHLSPEPRFSDPPRLFFVLSASLVPWCIIGTNIGTSFHFSAKSTLKFVITTVVLLCFVFTILRLFLLFRNRRSKTNTTECLAPESETKNSHIFEVRSAELAEKSGLCSNIFTPFNAVNVHTFKKRLISLFVILACLILYVITLTFEGLYISLPLRLVIALAGLFYSIKVRLTFRSPKFYSNPKTTDPDGNCEQQKSKSGRLGALLDTGIHFLLINTSIALIAGFCSGSIGIGSGIFMVPLLQYLNIPAISCSATANLLTLTMSTASLSRFILKIKIPPTMLVTVLTGSFMGTTLSILVIRTLTKDKITNMFVNLALIAFCATSVAVTWTF